MLLLSTKAAILALLVIAGVWFGVLWGRSLVALGRPALPRLRQILIGACTDFFDTLGIGSFAVTTSLYKLSGAKAQVPDRAIPGTLNVGHTLPTVAEALIYIAVVRVEPATLASMIAGAVAGAWLGAGWVSRWPVRPIRLGLGAALIGAAALMVAQQVHALPSGGDALGLHGVRLAVGVAGNVVLGALMSLGVGLYGPCMVLVSILGLNPIAAFPIMMGSCALLMPAASARFVARSAYAPAAALGLAIGGTPAVLVAAWLVRSLPLGSVRWLVVAVVVFAAAQLLTSGARPEPERS